LLLPAGQFVGAASRQAGGEADEFEQRLDVDRLASLASGQSEGDVAGDIEMREERAVLPDVADPSALWRNQDRSIGEYVAVDRDAPVVGPDEAGDRAEQGRLAAAGGAEYGGGAAGPHVQFDVLEYGRTAVPDGETGDGDARAGHRWSRTWRRSRMVSGADKAISAAA
jgi:hypothetical protein